MDRTLELQPRTRDGRGRARAALDRRVEPVVDLLEVKCGSCGAQREESERLIRTGRAFCTLCGCPGPAWEVN